MSNKETLFHFVYTTESDEKRKNEELGRNITEDKKSEYVFHGEPFYLVGKGHAFFYGFFTEYITKSGIVAWHYHSGKWIIENKDYNYIDDQFVLIPPPPPREPIDWSSIEFPQIKNLTGPIADRLPSVKPMSHPNE